MAASTINRYNVLSLYGGDSGGAAESELRPGASWMGDMYM